MKVFTYERRIIITRHFHVLTFNIQFSHLIIFNLIVLLTLLKKAPDRRLPQFSCIEIEYSDNMYINMSFL